MKNNITWQEVLHQLWSNDLFGDFRLLTELQKALLAYELDSDNEKIVSEAWNIYMNNDTYSSLIDENLLAEIEEKVLTK